MITLDGQIDSFGKKVICTTVYVKLVAPDQLLLSEAVCCQLGIVSYGQHCKFSRLSSSAHAVGICPTVHCGISLAPPAISTVTPDRYTYFLIKDGYSYREYICIVAYTYSLLHIILTSEFILLFSRNKANNGKLSVLMNFLKFYKMSSKQ